MAASAFSDLGGKWLAVGPDGTVPEMLFFPDRHGTFQGVDDPTASVERRSAMGGRDHDGHAGFADLQSAEAMHDRDISYGKLRQSLRSQGVQLLQGHFVISFVVEEQRPPSSRVVANHPFEEHD